VSEKCGAKCRDGHLCTQPPMHYQTRCRMHGASTPFKLRAAERRAQEAKATKAIQREGIAPLGDPVELLRDVTAEAVGLKDFFAARLTALRELRYEGHSGEQLRSEVALYERALDRSQKFLHDLARLGLDERQVRVSEAQLLILVGVISRGLASAGLPDDLRESARASIAAEMRLVEAGNG
jgi:hypothetical protein